MRNGSFSSPKAKQPHPFAVVQCQALFIEIGEITLPLITYDAYVRPRIFIFT